ncbi:MAG TPA: UvrD-helicase domain-containing protein, partial [Terrimesophilobacter sp.]|nr:UvrD-helicase domain-containing protein [Terrimesophilobacter sp.]
MGAPETDRAGDERMLRLDASQRAVLEASAGESLVVLGAPGSGKTTTLIELVADRVHSGGVDTSAILALAPSRTAATRLRDEIGARLGVTTAGPLARTANSLAFDVVARVRRSRGLTPPRLISGGEQDADVAALLAGHAEDGTGPDWPDRLGPDVRRLRVFRTELRELMMRATERGLSSEELRALGREHEHPEWIAAGDFMEEYRKVLGFARDDQFDSAELIALAVRSLDGGEPGELAEALRIVLVDDVQELSRSQLNLLAALARRGVAIVGFGDPDVATSAFRGAEPRAVGEFGALIGQSVRALALTTVYRHGAALREFTSRVIERIGTSGVVGHRSAQVAGARETPEASNPTEAPGRLAPVVAVRGASQGRERAAIARLLREHHLHSGVPFGSMGVIVRSGALVPGVARSLALANVPTRTTAADVALRDDAAARALLTVIDVGIGRAPLTADSAVELLTGHFGRLDRLGLRRLRLSLRAEELAGGGTRPSDELLIEALSEPGRLVTIEGHNARNAAALAQLLASVREAHEAGSTVEELLWL